MKSCIGKQSGSISGVCALRNKEKQSKNAATTLLCGFSIFVRTIMKNKNNKAFNARFLPIGLAVGIGIGIVIGAAMKNIGLGLCLGVGIGCVFGIIIGRTTGKK